jgi:uncharacterized membrane protein
MRNTFDRPTAAGEQMAGYQVAIFIVVFAAAGLGLAVWLFRRRAPRLVGSLVLVAVATVLTAVGYWLGIGFSFMYLDVATGVSAPLWAQWAVGAFFGIGLAAAAFGVATLVLGVRGAIIARRARRHPRPDSAVEQAHRADAAS